MSITLAQWLKLQGAEIGDYFFLTGTMRKIIAQYNDIYRYDGMGFIDSAETYNTQTVDPADLQLYRMVEGELKRINRPYITCTTCGRSAQIEKADGWCCYFENGSYCPDCEAKRKAQAVIKESLTTEKVKISPCPRCGSREIQVFRRLEDSFLVGRCSRCGLYDAAYTIEGIAEGWNNERQWTNIADEYEVEK